MLFFVNFFILGRYSKCWAWRHLRIPSQLDQPLKTWRVLRQKIVWKLKSGVDSASQSKIQIFKEIIAKCWFSQSRDLTRPTIVMGYSDDIIDIMTIHKCKPKFYSISVLIVNFSGYFVWIRMKTRYENNLKCIAHSSRLHTHIAIDKLL